MRLFFSEYQKDYSSYTFGYAVYAAEVAPEELPVVYEKGFLPYTGDTGMERELFYLARSIRVTFSDFSDTSENRRIDRKMATLEPKMEVFSREAFDWKDPQFLQFCTGYAGERFSGGHMNEERLKYVLTRSYFSHILVFTGAPGLLGYVLGCKGAGFFHYWFAFFDTQYLQSHSLGKWMMWRTLHWAQEEGLAYAYLGTCYQRKSLYKARDHKGVAFFDGAGWNENLNQLKELCEMDEQKPPDCDWHKKQWRTKQ